MIKAISLLLHLQYIALERVNITSYSRNHLRPSKKKEFPTSSNITIFPKKRIVE